jgi:hypothetical protein
MTLSGIGRDDDDKALALALVEARVQHVVALAVMVPVQPALLRQRGATHGLIARLLGRSRRHASIIVAAAAATAAGSHRRVQLRARAVDGHHDGQLRVDVRHEAVLRRRLPRWRLDVERHDGYDGALARVAPADVALRHAVVVVVRFKCLEVVEGLLARRAESEAFARRRREPSRGRINCPLTIHVDTKVDVSQNPPFPLP